ncbi:MAG: hypothetical protein IJ127_09860 [Afipia sp.]|nr:hypothetical protein [Afipia sp.]MBS4006641.1 hypothetical protein [Afipia sp.]
MAAVCASLGFCADVVAAALGAAAGAAAFAGADAAGAGAVSAFGAAAGSIALTACWQEPDSFDIFFCRHCNEAAPPGGTLAQFAS